MRSKSTPALMAACGLLVVVAWSCNIQPGGVGQEPAAESTAASASTAKLKPEPGVPNPGSAAARRQMKPVQPLNLTGPKASKPAPLPKAGKTLAIFHSGNIDGEVDPCG